MYNINYSIIKFEIKFLQDSKLNVNKQSAIRGIIGNTLINENCIMPLDKRECKDCLLNNKCIAQNIFSPKIKNGAVDEWISPFVIICDDKREFIKNGDIMSFAMIFFCGTVSYIPLVIRVVENAGKTLGIEKNKFKLLSVLNDKPDEIYDGEIIKPQLVNVKSLQEYIDYRLSISNDINVIKIINPIRFKKNKKFNDDLVEEDIINLIKRRLITLATLEERELEVQGDFTIEIKRKELKWEEFNRYSNRQSSRMSLGGVTGLIELGEISEDAKKLLIAGELIHIGKNTSFGLGDYILY